MGILIVFDIHVQASWELFRCPVDKHSIHLHSTGGTLSSAGLSLPHKLQAKNHSISKWHHKWDPLLYTWWEALPPGPLSVTWLALSKESCDDLLAVVKGYMRIEACLLRQGDKMCEDCMTSFQGRFKTLRSWHCSSVVPASGSRKGHPRQFHGEWRTNFQPTHRA
jgi:hypothetical protein